MTDSFCIDSVIFSVTLVLTVMIVAADPSVKNITAQYVLYSTTFRTRAHFPYALDSNFCEFSRIRTFSGLPGTVTLLALA